MDEEFPDEDISDEGYLEDEEEPLQDVDLSLDETDGDFEASIVRRVEDETGEFLLDDPLYEEEFGVTFESFETIPAALDIASVEVNDNEETYSFRIQAAGGGLAELFEERAKTVKYTVYLDTDLDGASDLLLTTTDTPYEGTVVSSDFEIIEQMPSLEMEDDAITLTVSREHAGDRFDWLVVSGYAPSEEAFYTTPLDNVSFVPNVDFAYPSGLHRTVNLLALHSRTRVIRSGYSRCPTSPTPPLKKVPGTRYKGYFISKWWAGARDVAVWCVNPNPGFFADRVSDTSPKGWVARCPFKCGQNSLRVRQSGNKLGAIYHTVADGHCGSVAKDRDGDGRLDVMAFTYKFNTNRVRSCNIERNPSSGVRLARRCKRPVAPYKDPRKVPGSVP